MVTVVPDSVKRNEEAPVEKIIGKSSMGFYPQWAGVYGDECNLPAQFVKNQIVVWHYDVEMKPVYGRIVRSFIDRYAGKVFMNYRIQLVDEVNKNRIVYSTDEDLARLNEGNKQLILSWFLED